MTGCNHVKKLRKLQNSSSRHKSLLVAVLLKRSMQESIRLTGYLRGAISLTRKKMRRCVNLTCKLSWVTDVKFDISIVNVRKNIVMAAKTLYNVSCASWNMLGASPRPTSGRSTRWSVIRRHAAGSTMLLISWIIAEFPLILTSFRQTETKRYQIPKN